MIKKNVNAILLVSLGLTLILPLIFKWLPFLNSTENWLSDIRMVSFTPQEIKEKSKISDVIVLSISEKTLAQFEYRSPVNRRFLASLLNFLSTTDVRAVGIDMLFDQATNADNDQLLKEAMIKLGKKVPFVVGRGGEEAGFTEKQLLFQKNYLQDILSGHSNLLKNEDGSVRFIFGGKKEKGMNSLAFTSLLLSALEDSEGLKVLQKDQQRLWYLADEKIKIKVYPSEFAANLPLAWFKDKIVLIGAALPQQDRHRTPLTSLGKGRKFGILPGVFIHAQTLAQGLDRREIIEPSFYWPFALLMAFFGSIMAILKIATYWKILTVMAGTILYWIAGFSLFSATGFLIPLLMPTVSLILSDGLMSAIVGQRNRREREFLRKAFSQYISEKVIKDIEKNPSGLVLGGEKRELSFIFTDIAGFTTLSESVPAETLVSVLQEYLDGMVDIALKNQGTIDKFIGDAVLVIFGAPGTQEDHSAKAISCAMEMDHFCQSYRKKVAEDGIELGITRIGVHTGVATVGNFGGSKRFDYTAIGDTVNTSARLESVNKHLKTRICISAPCYENAKDLLKGMNCRLVKIGELILKGKTEPLLTYTTVGDNGVADAYEQFYSLLEKDAGTEDKVNEVLKINPEFGPAIFHRARLIKGLNGTVIKMEEK